MFSATTADGRRTRAVVSVLVRGLGSLSFGRVLVGALMVWMAAVFISMSGGSVQADAISAHGEGPVAVELVGFVDQDFGGADDGTVVPPPRRANGAQGPSPTATGSIPVSKPARQFIPAPVPASEDTAYAATVAPPPQAANADQPATGQSATAPARRSPGGSEEFLTGLFDRLALQ